MSDFVATGTIARSADAVWAYAADIDRHTEWMTVRDAQVLAGVGTQAGARGRERMQLGPFGWDVEFVVAEATPGRRLVWTAVAGAPFDLTVTLDLQPVGPSETQATYGADIRLHGLWRLLGPMVAMEGKAGPERELHRLKERVEGTPAVAAATS